MTNQTDKQRAAIERLQAKVEDVEPKEHAKRMKAVLSVTRQEVEASLAQKKSTQSRK